MTRTGRIIAVLAGIAAFLVPATVSHSLWSTSATSSFTVTTATPAEPPVTCVFSVSGKKALTVSWVPTTGATRYDLRLTRQNGSYTDLANVTSPVLLTNELASGNHFTATITSKNAAGTVLRVVRFDIQVAAETCVVIP